nr:MAG TPA: hypothetical protein [Caudoviricetes sp.]
MTNGHFTIDCWSFSLYTMNCKRPKGQKLCEGNDI